MSPTDTAPALRVLDLHKRYGNQTVVRSASFDVQRGETVALLGPSGSGKTTTLRCIAGLERIDQGRISIRGTNVADGRASVAAGKRSIGMVFQNYALWPHMSVLRNVMFVAQHQGGASRAEARGTAEQLLRSLRLQDYTDRRPTMISGGQQQRVAVARALAGNPAILLMDEPLSALDTQLREDLRYELRQVIVESGLACVYVTHDQDEALSIADRLILMRQGELVETNRPENMYQAPQTLFGAQFFGCRNVLTGTVAGDAGDGKIRVQVGGSVLLASVTVHSWRPAVGDAVTLAFRSEAATVATGDGANRLPGVVGQSVFIGECWEHRVALADGNVLARGSAVSGPAEPVHVALDPEAVFAFPGTEADDTSAAATGDSPAQPAQTASA
jgi:iron(III) transport system ATP-binding protein